MEKLVKRIAQVGVIVRDLDTAVQAFEDDFGLDGWDIFDANEGFPDLLVDGEPGKLNIRGAITSVNGMEIELLEPIGPGPFADWLEQHGPGVHHMAIIMPDKNAAFPMVMRREADNGRKPWIRAEMVEGEPGKKMDFAYLDRREDMGVILEIYNEDKE